MIAPVKTRLVENAGVRLDDFADDLPKAATATLANATRDADGVIEGVTVTPLLGNADDRGSLFELLTTRDGPIEPLVHIYQVLAAPGSFTVISSTGSPSPWVNSKSPCMTCGRAAARRTVWPFMPSARNNRHCCGSRLW